MMYIVITLFIHILLYILYTSYIYNMMYIVITLFIHILLYILYTSYVYNMMYIIFIYFINILDTTYLVYNLYITYT